MAVNKDVKMYHVYREFTVMADSLLLTAQFQFMSLVDLGKQLLEAAKLGLTDQVRILMSNGAPFTTDWVSLNSAS
jgi:hypothetical protein